MVDANVFGWMLSPGSVVGRTCDAASRDPSNNHFSLMGAPWTRSARHWVVKTESNVKREKKRLPDPPCVICKGTGRVKCTRCSGKGRTNCTDQVMLPKGEWPKWCWDCSGCGKSYCTRCFGTGEKRGMIGFHLPDDNNGSQN